MEKRGGEEGWRGVEKRGGEEGWRRGVEKRVMICVAIY